MKPKNERYTIAVDFDGVIHSYSSPWVASHIIPDPPVDEAIAWLAAMIQKFDVVIFSTRCKTWRGRKAVRAWIKKYAGMLWYAIGNRGLEELRLTAVKPPALVYLDDRAMRFDGTFPTEQQIHQAKPWNKKG